MKIAWFTPFSKKSAIGKYSQIITDELSKYCSVHLWVPRHDDLLDTTLEVRIISNLTDPLRELCNYDLCVYNLGDYLDFHRDIFEVSRQIQGIVILHDFIMHHFFTGYYLVYKNKPSEFIEEMGRFYGDLGEKTAKDSLAGSCVPVWETDEIVKYPLFEKAVEGSLGVITHSHFLTEKVRRSTPLMVSTIYFPDCFSRDKIPPVSDHKSELRTDGNKLLFLTVGHVNPNKRIDRIIDALGRNPEFAVNIQYVVIGPYEESSYYKVIQELIAYYHLEDTVQFLGYQSEDVLYDYMRCADVMVNLRFPATEGASWSLLEQLYMGKPVIVTDNGFYSELSCEGLIKINPFNEQQEIAQALKKLCADKQLREQMGDKSKQFYEANFCTSKYCENFLAVATEILSKKPLMHLVDKVGEEFYLMGVKDELPVIESVAREISDLFWPER
jgi:glycosyltransferase involved in cell wall biosynthesis